MNPNQIQTPENTNPQPAVTPSAAPLDIAPKRRSKLPAVVLICILLLVSGLFGGYQLGKNSAAKTQKMTMATVASKEVAVPKGATLIAKCEKGKGAQYVLPKDIPGGPIYDVYQGKVIGVEYMVSKDQLEASASKPINLDLMSQKYNHTTLDLVEEGHAGFTMSHYHIDTMIAPSSTTDKITCADTPSSSPDSMSGMHM